MIPFNQEYTLSTQETLTCAVLLWWRGTDAAEPSFGTAFTGFISAVFGQCRMKKLNSNSALIASGRRMKYSVKEILLMSSCSIKDVIAIALLLLSSPIALAGSRFIGEGTAAATGGSVFDHAHVEIYGEISAEDAKTLPRLVDELKDRSGWRSYEGNAVMLVRLNSQGGNVAAAMRIGRILRANNAQVWVQGECSSACIFVLASGVDRNVITDSRIGLHRPYFEQSRFADLPAGEAKKVYADLIAECRGYLRDMGMEDKLLDSMLRIPSQDVRYISWTEAHDLGLSGTDPAYAEWARAKDLKRLGPERLKARDKYLKCLNSGPPDEVSIHAYDRCKELSEF